ncbi:MAG: flagellar export chaperone FliS [Magnetococcales bacterium]|nr:flagellar export chaperone FliS [Magnetococcales bacterium]
MEVSSQKAGALDAADLSPLEILIQLYEGAIRFLEQATEACEEGMVDEFKESLGRGQRIIEEFQRTLDFTQGSGVSNQLNDLYGFMLDNLAQAKLTHDVQYIQQVIKNLQILLDGWRGADTAQVEG